MKREGKIRNDFTNRNSNHSSFRKKQNDQKKLDDGKIRLNKFISNAGMCSRREADKFIEAGVVTVNGIGITEMGHRVSTDDIVKFNGQKIKSETLRYVLLNKPKNYSGRIDSGTQTISVMSLISSACKEQIFPIDKLNKSETGLLIFTNDTTMAKKIGSKNKIIKSIYQLTLNKNLSQNDLEKIREGVFMNGKKNTFNSISYILNKPKNEVGIEHNRGGTKYIKEIFEKLNYKTTKLDRVFFGGLTKKNLPRKHFRNLSQDEINILKRL
jgi:23S rRNA pseudouridine2605 synthase